MPVHTPHREQCRNCTCPQGNHLHNPVDNLTAELCKCFCHQYCDCEICLPPKVEPEVQQETFDVNCVKSDVAPNLMNLEHYGFRKLPEKLKEINEGRKLHSGGLINLPSEIVIGGKVFCQGNSYTVTGIWHNIVKGYSCIECQMELRPEDPEVCHACDCYLGVHVKGCVCSCHASCDCINCMAIKDKVKRVMASVKEILARKKIN